MAGTPTQVITAAVSILTLVFSGASLPVVLLALASTVSQLVTPAEQILFLGRLLAWSMSFPPYHGPTDTDEAQAQAAAVTNVINGITEKIVRGRVA